MKAHQMYYMDCHLAGRKFHDADLVWDYLRVGQQLRLERDIENSHDPYAVAVIYTKDGEDYLIGYIPRNENRDLAGILEMGWTEMFDCRISSINLDTHPENQVHLTISIKRKKEEPERSGKKK